MLLQQSNDLITVSDGQSPVMEANPESIQVHEVAKAVNFLRCGVPKVQLLAYKYGSGKSDRIVSEWQITLDLLEPDSYTIITISDQGISNKGLLVFEIVHNDKKS